MAELQMQPAAGERLVRYVGERVSFTLSGASDAHRVFLRTNIGRASAIRRGIIQQIQEPQVQVEASWRDVLMRREGDVWKVEFALAEVGWFQSKAYALNEDGQQEWPKGDNLGLSVHPNDSRCANTIYCAFPRMFGPNKTTRDTTARDEDEHIRKLDHEGYTVIPPSGTFRDLIAELPHIMDTLGCRILHLLPVNPTPTTYARMGRFGSPYACGDLIAIDPALAVFDKRATVVQQFCELADSVHAHGGRLFLDLVINHTGWGSTLQEQHPEWFRREEDGEFASPGAWGNVWSDLVELDPHHRELWEHLADAFLTWCQRGVDGFRCDAGYKVPMPVWRYIIARVREDFPDTVFLLEGLGGGWEDTENLITRGGMQWAYSELFQEYTGDRIAAYLDHAINQSHRVGTLIHYSETHDNPRLAEKGRIWSLMRNRLCALTSVSGAYGFTNGVEWLADERVNVHNARGLAWGCEDNLVKELSQLNQLLTDHPCFHDGATLKRWSPDDSDVYAIERVSECGQRVLVLINVDHESPHSIEILGNDLKVNESWVDLIDDSRLNADWDSDDARFSLEPGQVCCLSASKVDFPSNYRVKRAQAAWAIQCLSTVFEPEELGPFDWREMADTVACEPELFLACISRLDAGALTDDLLAALRTQMGVQNYLQAVTWRVADASRIMPVPEGHWFLLRDDHPFRVTLELGGKLVQAESVPMSDGHAAAFPPQEMGEGQITMRRLTQKPLPVCGSVLFLGMTPENKSFGATEIRKNGDVLNAPLALLANGRGAMARLGVDLGHVKSKYDCLLAANLHESVPVDRHVFAKRIRVWAIADGFITPLDADNLLCFKPGVPAFWKFLVSAGDGRTVEIEMSAAMPEDENATMLEFRRADGLPVKGNALSPSKTFSLTVRVDLEDRSFHSETTLDDGYERYFEVSTRKLDAASGFVFEPAPERRLEVRASSGKYHPEIEWCRDIKHPVEESRGHRESGDAYSPGWFELPMAPGERVVLSVNVGASSDATDRKPREKESEAQFAGRLKGSLGHFIVRRGTGKTVIAGYPWFLDWGRDTLIVARGMLAAGMVEEVCDLVVTFASLEENGTLPNTLQGDNAANRDTSDAPLWFGVICEELTASGLDLSRLQAADRSVLEVLQSIASNYRDGTPNGIRMDEVSGLIWSPTHFTWMDTNHPAGTPREGYPVEIQALWIRLLRQLGEGWDELRLQTETSFKKLFSLEEGWLADQLVADEGKSAIDAMPDNALRSNGLLAVALGVVESKPARQMVAAAQRHLVVPGAVRSLAPLVVNPPLPIMSLDGTLLNEPDKPYCGRYEGDEDTRRKPAYHNGTAWVWSLPVFCEALAQAWDFKPQSVAAAKSYLLSAETLLNEGCLGHLPEILDGDTPHTQRGCDAQAWSVSEAYRVWKLLNEKQQQGTEAI